MGSAPKRVWISEVHYLVVTCVTLLGANCQRKLYLHALICFQCIAMQNVHTTNTDQIKHFMKFCHWRRIMVVVVGGLQTSAAV